MNPGEDEIKLDNPSKSGLEPREFRRSSKEKILADQNEDEQKIFFKISTDEFQEIMNELNRTYAINLEKIDSAHIEELNRFNGDWDKVIQELNDTAKDLATSLVMKHKEDKQKLIDDFNQRVRITPPTTGDLMYLKKTKKYLLKQDSPEEVKYIKKKIKETEQQVIEQEEQIYKEKLKKFTDNLDAKQLQEKKSLGQRVMAALKEKEKERITSTEMLLQAYQNRRKDFVKEFQKLSQSVINHYQNRRWTTIMDTIKIYYDQIKEKYGLEYEPLPDSNAEEPQDENKEDKVNN